MVSSTGLSKAPRRTLRTLTQGHLRLLEIFLLCQDPGGRCCHDLVVPDDLSLLQRGQPNSPLLVPRPCPFSASQVTWEVAVDSAVDFLGDSPRGSLERSTVLSSQGHQPLQQPPMALEVQLLSPPLISAQSSQCLQVRVFGPLPERHTRMPIRAIAA